MYKSIQRQTFHCWPGYSLRHPSHLSYNDSNLSSGVGWVVSIPPQKPPLLWKPRVAREKRLKTWMTWQWCFSARVLRINFDPHALIHFVSHILHALTSVPQQQQIVTFDRGMLLHHPSGIRLCRYGGSVWDTFYTYLWHEWSQMISNDPSDHFAGWGWSKWSNTSSKGSSLRWRFRCFWSFVCTFLRNAWTASAASVNSAAQSLSHHYEAFLKVNLR